MATYNPGTGFIEISSRYGDTRKKTDYKTGKIVSYGHEGDDWAADLGVPIPAAADGEVSLVAWDKEGYGHYIALKHTDNQNQEVYTIYAQMRQKSPLALNTRVKKGEIVGNVGMTGETSRGSHLHFEIRLGHFYNRKTVDPSTYDLSQLKSFDDLAQSSSTTISQPVNSNSVEANEDANSCTTTTACEELQLIVEIVGKIPSDYTDQKIVIYTEQDSYDAATTAKVQKEEFIEDETTAKTSVLHKWDWQSNQKAHLWLEVKATDGKPIRMPLLNGMQGVNSESPVADLLKAIATPLQSGRHTQKNLIVPVVPTTESIERSYYATQQTPPPSDIATQLKAHPILCRAGWVYIFRLGKLWRELQIRQDELTGKTTYHDVRLYGEGGCLEADGTVSSEIERNPVGTGLEDIWLPARFNEIGQSLKVFYAESQLTAARLNYLQTHPEKLKARSHTVAMSPHAMQLDINSSSWQPRPSKPFLLYGKVAGKMYQALGHIPRDQGREYMFFSPSKFLKAECYGLKPLSYLQQVFTESKKLHNELGDPETYHRGIPVYRKLNYTNSNFEGYGCIKADISPSAWVYNLKEKLYANFCKEAPTKEQAEDNTSPWNKYPITDEEKEIWCQTPAAETTLNNQPQVLNDAIEKRICGLFLFDAIHWVNHLYHQIQHNWTLQSFLADQATLRNNYGSAFLVQNIMLEAGAQKEGKDDLRYKAIEEHFLSEANKTNIRERIDFALGDKERKLVAKEITAHQTMLLHVLKHPLTVESIKDTTSCLDLDKLGGCNNLINLLKVFESPTSTDLLARPSQSRRGYSLKNQAISLIKEGQPYHGILCNPVQDATELLDEYKKSPIAKVEPRGDGLWQPEAFAKIEDMTDAEIEAALQGDKLKTVQGNIITLGALLGFDTTMALTSKAASALVSYAGNLSTIIESLTKELKDQQSKLEKVETRISNVEAEEQRLTSERDKIQADIDDIKNKQLPQTKQKITSAEQEIKALERRKSELINKHGNLTDAQQQRIAELKRIQNIQLIDEQILAWTKPNAIEQQLQNIINQKRQNSATLVDLYQTKAGYEQQLATLENELAAKQQQIAQHQQTITNERANAPEAAKNRGIKVSYQQKVGFTTLKVARELASKSLGSPIIIQPELTIFDAKKQQLAQGDWVAIGVFDDNAVENIGDGRRRSLLSTEIALIKIDENGNAIPPKGVTQQVAQQAVNSGQPVMMKGLYIGINRKSTFYKNFVRTIAKVKELLAQDQAKYDAMVNTKAGIIQSIEEVDQKINDLERETAQLSEEQRKLQEEWKNAQIDQKEKQIAQLEQQKNTTQAEINKRELRIRELQQQNPQTKAEQAELIRTQGELEILKANHNQLLAEAGQQRVALEAEKAAIQAKVNIVTNNLLRVQGNALLSSLSSKNARTLAAGAIGARNGVVKAMQHPATPWLLSVFQLYNINNFMSEASSMESGTFALEFANVFFNTAATLEGVIATLALNKAKYQTLIVQRNVIFPATFARMGLRFFTVRFLLQGPAAIIGVILAGRDMYHSWTDKDWPALLGNHLILGSALANVAIAVISIGLNLATPVLGWLLLAMVALFFLGTYIKYKFQDTPYEKWLKHGPFADADDIGRYEHLQDEQHGFYRLVCLLCELSITHQEVTEEQLSTELWRAFTGGEKRPQRLLQVSINSAIPGLLTNPKEFLIQGDITTLAPLVLRPKQRKPAYYYQQKTPTGFNLFFDTNNDVKPFVEEEIADIINSRVKNGRETVEQANQHVEQQNLRRHYGIAFEYRIRLQVKLKDIANGEYTLPNTTALYKPYTPSDKAQELPTVESKAIFNFWSTENLWMTKFIQLGGATEYADI